MGVRVTVAEAWPDRMVTVFENKGVNPQVLQKIRLQAEAVKDSIAADSGSGPRKRS